MGDSWVTTKVSAADSDTEEGRKFLAEHRRRIVRTYADGSVDMRWRASELRKASE